MIKKNTPTAQKKQSRSKMSEYDKLRFWHNLVAEKLSFKNFAETTYKKLDIHVTNLFDQKKLKSPFNKTDFINTWLDTEHGRRVNYQVNTGLLVKVVFNCSGCYIWHWTPNCNEVFFKFQIYIYNYDCFYLFAKFYVIMCLTRILKRWRTAKKTRFRSRCH